MPTPVVPEATSNNLTSDREMQHQTSFAKVAARFIIGKDLPSVWMYLCRIATTSILRATSIKLS